MKKVLFLRHKWFDAGRWSAEESLGGHLSGSSPAVASWEPVRATTDGRSRRY